MSSDATLGIRLPGPTLGANLAAKRRDLHWSQSDLAKRAGLSRPTVARLESGHNTQSVTMAQVIGALRQGYIERGHSEEEADRFLDAPSKDAAIDGKQRRVSRMRSPRKRKSNVVTTTLEQHQHHADQQHAAQRKHQEKLQKLAAKNSSTKAPFTPAVKEEQRVSPVADERAPQPIFEAPIDDAKEVFQ